MRIEKVKINPQIAAEMLSHNGRNRKLSRGIIKNYAEDMRNGEWQESPEPISFYKGGDLRDGQHRLNAVIESGKEIEFYVAYDVPDDSTICDRQRKRTYSNILSMAGYGADITDKGASGACRFLLAEVHAETRKAPDSCFLRFVAENEDVISFASRASRTDSHKPVLRKAPVIAAFICAQWYGIPRDKITRFASCANTGFYSGDEETAAIAFRNTITTEISTGTRAQREAFFACCAALYDFSKGTPRRMKYSGKSADRIYSSVKGKFLDKYAEG